MSALIQILVLTVLFTIVFISGYNRGKVVKENEITKRHENYKKFYKVMDEVLSEPDDMTEFNEIDDDTIPDSSGLTTYYQNRYGESYDDCMTGDISKSSRTDTNRDILA